MKIDNIFLNVKDPRKARGTRYDINAVLHAVLAGLISNKNTLKSIWRFCKGLTLVQKHGLGFDNGIIPCYSNITVLLRRIDPQELQASISKLSGDALQSVMKIMHTDGKTMRGSLDITNDARKLLSAYNPDTKTVVAHEEITNYDELKAMSTLIANNNLQNTIITGDAIFGSPKICAEIKAKEGHFLFTVKNNKRRLKKDILKAFNDSESKVWQIRKFTEDISLAHGRVEQRSIEAMDMPWQYLNGYANIKQICRIVRHRHDKKSNIGTTETALAITSVDKTLASAQQLLALNRSHWSVENNLHWIKDAIFGEDKSKVRKDNAPIVFSLLRGLAISVLASISNKITETREWFGSVKSRVVKLFAPRAHPSSA